MLGEFAILYRQGAKLIVELRRPAVARLDDEGDLQLEVNDLAEAVRLQAPVLDPSSTGTATTVTGSVGTALLDLAAMQ